jgi:flagellar biosynthesis/type III secretory pathway M-ring protein FliF/YscJ
VETLPFESSLNAEPPPRPLRPVSTPASKVPPWLEFATKYRDLWAPATLGVALLLFLVRGMFRIRRRVPAREMELPDELEAPSVRTEFSPEAAGIAAGAIAAPVEDHNELAERVRTVAKREPELTANVLRMWLQESNERRRQEAVTQTQ